MAQWLSWLERRPVTAKVESSSLFWVVNSGNFRETDKNNSVVLIKRVSRCF